MFCKKLKSMKFKLFFLFLFLFAANVFAQQNLKPNAPVKFRLQPGETKDFNLSMQKDDFAEISIKSQDGFEPAYSIVSPSGRDVTNMGIVFENSFPFIALESGEYKINIEYKKSEDSSSTKDFSIVYKNKFTQPKGASLTDSRKINGYDAKIYEEKKEFGNAYLVIEKAGKLKYILKGSSFATGLHFPSNISQDASAEEKRSANLFRTTADKTGDGTPDMAVEYYSGGAHCCFSMYFFELGNEVRPIPVLYTNNTPTLAVGKNPEGGLKLVTGDNTFAYWNTSFAGSPIPQVILTFRNGEFRTNAKLMAKPAPPVAKLKQKAAAARREMSLEPYEGEDTGSFMNAFWGEMLDLIYSGHEDLAWQYFDWAWNPKKKGKELFKQDFKNQLANSEFYRMYLESK